MTKDLAATVMVPSHDHGPLLQISVSTALSQTVEAIEVLIVLDGADDQTQETAWELTQQDERVRVFDFPKGERHGEAHRHRVLAEARGSIVCYLADDDLWLPRHLEQMVALLEDADFGSALAVFDMVGWVRTIPGDLAEPRFRARLLADPPANFIGLSQGAHSLEAYRRLPTGWCPAPVGLPTDLHMWRQFLADERIRAATAQEVTVLTFPSPRRPTMTMAARREELAGYRERIADPAGRSAVLAKALGPVHGQGTQLAGRVMGLENDREHLRVRVQELEDEVRARIDEVDAVHRELNHIRDSLSFRASRRLAAIPGIGRIGRGLARLIAGRRRDDSGVG